MSGEIISKFINAFGIVLMNTISWLWGPLDGLLIGCLFFMLTDVITGMVGALSTGTYDSSKFSLKKKIGVLVAVAVIYRLDSIIPQLSQYIPALGEWSEPLRDAAIALFIANDVASIFENLEGWGVHLPKVITDRLARLKGKQEEKQHDND